jgi:hypothetical protein
VITGWRIVRPEFADDAYSGLGARRDGGRWNSRGVAVVYASASLSVATLELLVNVPATLRAGGIQLPAQPEHPDFRSVDIGQPRPFHVDVRLFT